jgi:hypothetical protein
MGSLLLLLFGGFVALAHAASRAFLADCATRRALQHEATHDALVGLANRAEFHRRAAELDAQASIGYLCPIDLDRFKRSMTPPVTRRRRISVESAHLRQSVRKATLRGSAGTSSRF